MGFHFSEVPGDAANPPELVLKIEGPMMIQDLAALELEVKNHWSLKQRLRVDLSDVDEIDTAALQWLAFIRSWASRWHRELELSPLSDVVADQIGLFRIEALLGITTVIPRGQVREEVTDAQ